MSVSVLQWLDDGCPSFGVPDGAIRKLVTGHRIALEERGAAVAHVMELEAKLAGVEDVVRKLYADIRESYLTDNYDGGDFRRWLWTLEEMLEIPMDQR